MTEKQIPRDNFEIFRILLIQVTILTFCLVLLLILSQFKIASIDTILNENPSQLLLQNLFWLLSFNLPTYFIFKIYFQTCFVKLNSSLQANQVLRAVVGGVFTFILMLFISFLLSLLGIKPRNNEFQTKLFSLLKGNSNLLYWSILTLGILTGLLEEIMFRGFLLGQFIERGFSHEGLFITSIIFGFMHYSTGVSLIIPLLLTLVGILFGLLYIRYKNIWIPVGAHVTYNSLGLITAYFLGDTLL